MTEQMAISAIRVADRHRVDLGDLGDLAASIACDGLIQPVVVTESGQLVAGQRRLHACMSLGWTEVPVRVIRGVTDAAALLRMERDENTCRKDMTPSEQVALGRALEALERPKAKQRIDSGRERSHAARRGDAVGSVPQNGAKQRYDTREVVAPAVGMSTASYSRAKQLITAAENGDQRAAEAVAEMDRTGKITKPYERWKGHPVNRRSAAPRTRDPYGIGKSEPPSKPVAEKKPNVKNYRGNAPAKAMENAIATLSGITTPMKDITSADFGDVPDEVRARWCRELTEVLSTLRRARDLIKENT